MIHSNPNSGWGLFDLFYNIAVSDTDLGYVLFLF